MALFTDTIILEMVHNTSYFEDFTSVTRALMLVLDIGTTENIPSVISFREFAQSAARHAIDEEENDQPGSAHDREMNDIL